MASTDLQIAGLGLAKLGITTGVSTLSAVLGDANELYDQLASVNYPIARDLLLAAHHWTFATVREDPTEDTLEERDGWEYVYPLASDLIEMQMIWDGERMPSTLARGVYDIEHDADDARRILLTDYLDPTVIYTARVDEAYWPEYFVEAMAAKLAKLMAPALMKKPSLVQQLTREALIAQHEAITLDLRSIQEDPEPESPFISGR